tara:strand:- start:73 stop:252 length:180 start_codon:yes stop_codon:yes gene_type:complete
MDKRWQDEFIETYGPTLTQRQRELLTNGADSLGSAYYLAAMHNKWKKNHETTINENTEV